MSYEAKFSRYKVVKTHTSDSSELNDKIQKLFA